MYLTSEKKQDIFKTYGKSETNTGVSESQIALFTYRINHLTEHLKKSKKDFSTSGLCSGWLVNAEDCLIIFVTGT
jgi:small subunit ribosomal protein S15